MSERFLEALEAKTFLARWWKSAGGAEFAEYWAESCIQKGWEPTRAVLFTNDTMKSAHRAALEGDPFWVAREMVTFAEAAMATWPGEPFEAAHLPTIRGFVVLERSISGTDENGQDFHLRAFSWDSTIITDQKTGKLRSGVMVHVYADKHDPLDPQFDSIRGTVGFQKTPTWVLFHSASWKFGEYEPTQNHEEGIHREPYFNFIRVFWSLCSQEIPHTTMAQPTRASWRQAQREGIKHVSAIRVIDLRKYRDRKKDDPDHESGFVDWSHRWIVSGHWRRQWYPHEGVHRLKYIHPYVKGPEDRPLVEKRPLYRVVR